MNHGSLPIRVVFFLVSLVFVFLITIPQCMLSYDFNKNCGSWLQLTANANTIDVAKSRLDVAIAYLEKHRLTTGNTALWLPTPLTDVEEWYNNLKKTQNELSNLPTKISPLEQSNVLMKVRETLTDTGKDGTVLSMPAGIAAFRSPFYKVYAIATCPICVIFGLSVIILLAYWDL